MLVVWIALALVFLLLEAMTTQIVSIWFAVGAVGALASYFLGASVTVQCVVFVIVSALALIVTRPLVKKFSKPDIKPTNADMAIGKEAVVTEEINNIFSKGAVKLSGLEWTARSENDEVIPAGEIVTVKAIEGVKLIVTKSKN